MRTEWTESAVVVGTRRALCLWVNMEVQAIVAVGACLRAGVVGAFGHATKVVLVQELACFAFLAKAA